jgi:two-component system NtrC family sensor kinase
MVEALKADLCLISRWEKSENQLRVIQSYAGPGYHRPERTILRVDNPSLPLSILESQNSTMLETSSTELLDEGIDWLEELETQALFLIPLIYRRQTIGLVEIGRLKATVPVTRKDLRLAETMVAQAAVAIEHARLYDEITRRLAEAKVLQEVMVAAASTLDFNRVLSGTIEALHRTLGIERLGFFLPDENGASIISHPATIGFPFRNGSLYVPVEGSAVGWVVRNGKPLLIPNVKETRHYFELASDTLSEMCVPVLLNRKVAAVLNAESPRLNAFDQEDLRLFSAIAAELAVALENAKLFQKEHRLVSQQQALLDVFKDLSSELKPEVLFQRIIERAIEVIPNADAGSLIVPKDDLFVYAAAVGFEMEKLQQFAFARKDFLEHQSRAQIERLSAAEASEIGRKNFPLTYDQIAEAGRFDEIKCTLRATLYAGDDVIGSINIDSLTKTDAFTDEDEQTLLLFASQAAIAIQNAHLFEEIRTAEANYRDLFDNANDFIFTVDSDFRISSANKVVLNSTGYGPEEIIGIKVTRFVPPDQRPRIFKLLKRRLASVQAPATFELPVWGKHRRETILEVTIRVQREGKRPVSVHCIARDITMRRQLEQQLRQTEKLSTIGKLVAGVAHELNNPLTSIIGYASLLQDSDLPKDQQEDLKVIFRQAQRARVIVRDLLTFARKIDLETEPVDLNEIIQASLSLMKPHLQNQNIKLTTSLDLGLPQTIADPHQLEQVFINLITNAVQALAANEGSRQLIIESRHEADTILLSIADNGPGISNDIINRLFDPFFSTKQVGEGTGLGLSICFGIISEHKGRIWADHALNGGAIFHIELPVVPVQEPAMVLPGPAVADVGLSAGDNALCILVVDDEPSLLNLLRRVLEKQGHRVETASNGQTALQSVSAQSFDLVICDVLMPDILGTELYYQAIEISPNLAGHFVFITGNVVDIDTRTFLEKSGLPWLPKPFLPVDIERVIEQTAAKTTLPI